MTSEFRETIDELEDIIFSDGAGAVCAWVNKNQNNIRRALLIADRLMQDPTDRLTTSSSTADWVDACMWECMRNEMLKEINQEKGS